ncbi:MAG TPA: SRPBCC family protein [Dehalococcoidia bacterium]|nr:SRPBCC family protein [Dehalococcoidia bacterium]
MSYRIKLSIEIEAPVERVWRALCDPGEVARWDPGVAEALDAPVDYPRPGQTVRWRTRSGGELIDAVQEVEPPRRLRSVLVVDEVRIDETYELTATERGCRVDCRLGAQMQSAWTNAFLFLLIGPRIAMGSAVRASFQTSLAGLKRFCETERDAHPTSTSG